MFRALERTLQEEEVFLPGSQCTECVPRLLQCLLLSLRYWVPAGHSFVQPLADLCLLLLRQQWWSEEPSPSPAPISSAPTQMHIVRLTVLTQYLS